MITERYSLTSSLFKGSLVFAYRKGVLTGFINDAELNEAQMGWLHSRFPMLRDQLATLVNNSPTVTITRLAADLTFTTFWDAYGYKVGHKDRAERLWNKLTDADRQLVLDSIIGYNYYTMCHPNMERLYAETYLSQRRFETDYRALTKK